MTRTAYIHCFDILPPHERAAEEPGRARRRNDFPKSYLSADVSAEWDDVGNVAKSGGIVRPDRRTVRDGKFGRLWLFDYVAAGM